MRHSLRPMASGDRAEDNHYGEQRGDEREVVLLEDHLDHIADRGELDERANRGNDDVALQVGALPDRDQRRDADERQRRRDLPDAGMDRGHQAVTAWGCGWIRPPSKASTRSPS